MSAIGWADDNGRRAAIVVSYRSDAGSRLHGAVPLLDKSILRDNVIWRWFIAPLCAARPGVSDRAHLSPAWDSARRRKAQRVSRKHVITARADRN